MNNNLTKRQFLTSLAALPFISKGESSYDAMETTKSNQIPHGIDEIGKVLAMQVFPTLMARKREIGYFNDEELNKLKDEMNAFFQPFKDSGIWYNHHIFIKKLCDSHSELYNIKNVSKNDNRLLVCFWVQVNEHDKPRQRLWLTKNGFIK